MKITGLFRRFDELGRINIPKEARRQVFGKDCTEGKVMEIFTAGDLIILKKHEEEGCKPKTNADRIRVMSDEKLATFLYATADNLHTVKCSMQDILEWLESDAQC